MGHLQSGSAHHAGWLFIAILPLLPTLLFAQTPQDFSIVLLPDTQYYSETYPDFFKQQTKWIVDNRSAWNTKFVVGEGDIVNTPSQTYEWMNADEAIKTLESAGIPYALAIGNHDYDSIAPTKRGTTAYNQWFGVKRYTPFPWYGGHLGTTNENFYATFSVNGQRYLVIVLEYYPRDQALSWADSLMNANPGAMVFITTHSFIYTDGTRGDLCDTADMRNTTGRNAETVWETMLKKHANVQLVVSGHLTAANSAHRTDLGTTGNVVNQIFTNFQNWSKGGTGYLRILKFRPSLNRIEVYTYSTYLKQFLTTSTYQFTLPITNNGNTATTGALEGKVRTRSCTNVANAEVSISGVSVITDASGRFKMPNLAAPANYTASVEATGYNSQLKTTTVYSGYSTQVDFYLTAASSNASCTLNSIDPSVTICSPAPNATVSSPVHINAGTTAAAGVKYMQIYVDGVKQNTFYSSSFDTNVSMTNATHRLTVQALLNNGTYVKSTINITVGSGGSGGGSGGGASGVTMTSPVDGSVVSNPVSVKATATSTVAISYIQLYVDGVKMNQVSGNTMNLNVTLSSGAHRVTAQAKDANGVLYKQTANITVK